MGKLQETIDLLSKAIYELEELKKPREEPKFGDVGYFWDDEQNSYVYGKIKAIDDDDFPFREESTCYFSKNFSKTKPQWIIDMEVKDADNS